MAPLSSQSTSVLMALATEPSAWRHGYDLAKQTGLKSGSLYPILIRFAERGLIEASGRGWRFKVAKPSAAG